MKQGIPPQIAELYSQFEKLNSYVNDFNKQKNKELRETFKEYIKPNILICLKEDIKQMPEFQELAKVCYSHEINKNPMLQVDDIDFDICCHLAMINWYLLSDLPKEKHHERYNDSTYLETLKDRTISQCRIRGLLANFEDKNFLFAYAPLNYAMHCTTNFLIGRIEYRLRKKQCPKLQNIVFKINSLRVMLKTIKSILLLIAVDDCGNAFSLFRSLIESILVYLTVWDNEAAANEYFKFIQFRSEYESTGNYPQEFIDLLPEKVQRQNYLNYGWLDVIEQKKRNYTIQDLLDYSRPIDQDHNSSLLKNYKYCCKFSHGNYIQHTLDPNSYLYILVNVCGYLINLSMQFSNIFEEEVSYNEFNLTDYLISVYKEAIKMLNILMPVKNEE